MVENDYESAVELKKSLEDLGFEIMDIVENLDEAVDIAAQKCPIVTIINVKSVDKLTAIKCSEMIMQLNLPVIYLIGEESGGNLVNILKKSSGCGFIKKRHDKKMLKNQIENVLRRFSIENEKLNLAHGFIK